MISSTHSVGGEPFGLSGHHLHRLGSHPAAGAILQVPIVSKPDIRTLLRCIPGQPEAAARGGDVARSVPQNRGLIIAATSVAAQAGLAPSGERVEERPGAWTGEGALGIVWSGGLAPGDG